MQSSDQGRRLRASAYAALKKCCKISKNVLTKRPSVDIIHKLSDRTIEYGGIAQLGERLNGIQEVSGSIPLISTKTPRTQGFSVFFYFPNFLVDFGLWLQRLDRLYFSEF